MKQHIPLLESFMKTYENDDGGYPAGAANDPDAPYNQVDEEHPFDIDSLSVGVIQPFDNKITVGITDQYHNEDVVEISFKELFDMFKEFNADFEEGDEIISVQRTESTINVGGHDKKIDVHKIMTKNGMLADLYDDDEILVDYLKGILE